MVASLCDTVVEPTSELDYVPKLAKAGADQHAGSRCTSKSTPPATRPTSERRLPCLPGLARLTLFDKSPVFFCIDRRKTLTILRRSRKPPLCRAGNRVAIEMDTTALHVPPGGPVGPSGRASV